jgi:hypothetical protein
VASSASRSSQLCTIIFGVSGNKVSMHVLINYEGPAEGFSWLLPIMFEPTLNTSSDPFFRGMFDQTLPQFTFSVDSEDSDTCNGEAIGSGGCVSITSAPAPPPTSGSDGGVEVKKGNVGPFEYKIIKAVNKDVFTIRDWLATNGYDEYVGSAEIINYYVQHDFYFLALRLRKDTDTGDLVPIAIEYEMPEGMDTIACIPLILTGVAATQTMPIQVYILGDHRAEPVNYFRVELDETQVDWVGCQGSSSCFDRDYRNRAATAFKAVDDHAFIVEYAGNSNVMNDQIRFDIDQDALARSSYPLAFLDILVIANVPSFGLLDNIINDFIPLEFDDAAPPFCDSMPSLYDPAQRFRMNDCAGFLKTQTFEAAGLASELKARVFDPAQRAQDFTDSFTYLTRLYVQMRQEKMVKDPFFRFRENETLPDVLSTHTATGIPICDVDEGFNALEVTVTDGSSVVVNAVLNCGRWWRADFDRLYGDDNSPAKHLIAPGFGSEEERILERLEDGTFDKQVIDAYVSMMDGRVMDQTIDPLPTLSPDATSRPTSAPEPSSSHFTKPIVTLMASGFLILFV